MLTPFLLPGIDTVYLHMWWAVTTSQPVIADRFSQTICYHHALALYAAVFRPNSFYDPFSHPPVFKVVLTLHHYWFPWTDFWPEQLCFINYSNSCTFITIDTKQIPDSNQLHIEVKNSRRIQSKRDVLGESTFKSQPKIALWEQDRLWILEWTQLPYFWQMTCVFAFSAWAATNIHPHQDWGTAAALSQNEEAKCYDGILSLLGFEETQRQIVRE